MDKLQDMPKGLKTIRNPFPHPIEEYRYIGRWPCDIFTSNFWTADYVPELDRSLDLHFEEEGSISMNEGHFFEWEGMVSRIQKRVEKAVRAKDTRYFRSMRNAMEQARKNAIADGKRLRTLPAHEKTMREFMEAAKPLSYLWYYSNILTDVLDLEVAKIAVKEHIPAETISQYIPKVETPLIRREKDLRKMKSILRQNGLFHLPMGKRLSKIRQDKKLLALFRKHIENYGWAEVFNFLVSEMTLARLLKDIHDFQEPPPLRIKKKSVSKQAKQVFEFASIASYMRQVGGEYFSEFTLIIFPFLRRAAKTLGVSYTDMLKLTREEVAQFLGKNDPRRMKKLIARRKKGKWAVFSDPHHRSLTIDDSKLLDYLSRIMIPTANTAIRELRGQIANQGIAMGKVSVIMTPAESKKMKTGNILVTTMTTPDFVQLMRMSAGIVTDIGGMLSHATIVSRELGKPCVIGTKFATQILKNGDLVEVDANKGVVKILKKA